MGLVYKASMVVIERISAKREVSSNFSVIGVF